jgi:hypothetical protein
MTRRKRKGCTLCKSCLFSERIYRPKMKCFHKGKQAGKNSLTCSGYEKTSAYK